MLSPMVSELEVKLIADNWLIQGKTSTHLVTRSDLFCVRSKGDTQERNKKQDFPLQRYIVIPRSVNFTELSVVNLEIMTKYFTTG